MRVPTSVLLAVLAAAGLLALAPALVRRYDATERLVAERAQSTARVLQRQRRRRTVPGRRPVRPPRSLVVTLSEDSATGGLTRPVSAPPAAGRRSGRLRAVPPAPNRARRRPPSRRHTPAVYRRRRVLAALLLLNGVELIGVLVVGPGFWISFSVTGTLLVAYVVHLRQRAIADQRRRRARAREAAWLAARQAEVRREQARRAAARREAQRRLAAQREVVRRAAMGLDRPADLPPAANGGSVSYRRAGGLRGRAYEAGRGSHTA
ncbi:divisome protein SepX/GlpR [Micromonospora sp. URMC 103]|uniref:divisome protein SepX/GlpR n=1 Tax=Micromonospora sp. URMC 103 TaxID=3423406 RepID=UPI003F196F88